MMNCRISAGWPSSTTTRLPSCKKVLFDGDAQGRPGPPLLDNFQAGVLLEVIKDLLYQAYVRRGRLQQAMMMRRYFAEDSDSKVTPLPTRGPEPERSA